MNIESLTNNRVKEWVKLNTKKYRDETGLFLIEGDHLVKEASKKQFIKEIITTDKNIKADYYVTPEIMKKISNQVSVSNVAAVCYKIKERNLTNKILLLDNIQDPGNLGTIIRSAVAFNFDTIILSEDTVDIYNDKVIRASEGMIFHLNILRRNSISFIKEEASNYQILVTDVLLGKNIRKITLADKIILVIGNEGNGVKKEIKEFRNEFINIKMNKNCESLNAGVSASILMYEINEVEHE